MSVRPDRPDRFKDRHLSIVQEWRSGCLLCDEAATVQRLPCSDGSFYLPLCRRHVRWAMASRRERVGRQARHLKLFLLAWCRLRGGDQAAARQWLGY
jgi:hypothetical protein